METTYEEDLRDEYEVAMKILRNKLRRNSDLSLRLIVKLSMAEDLDFYSKDQIHSLLDDSWTIGHELDHLHTDEFAGDVNTLLGLRKKIESEMNGDEPDPTFGTRNRDFAGPQIKFI